MLQDQSKDLNLRFVKSELEELRFRYDDAKHDGASDRGHPRSASRRESSSRPSGSRSTPTRRRTSRTSAARSRPRRAPSKTAEDALAKLDRRPRRARAEAREHLARPLPGPDAVAAVHQDGVAAEDPEDPAGRARGVRSQRLQPAGRARRSLHLVPHRHQQARLRGSAESVEDAPQARALPRQARSGQVRLHAVPQRRRHGGQQPEGRARRLLRRRRPAARVHLREHRRCFRGDKMQSQLHQVPPERGSTSTAHRRSRGARSSSSSSGATAAISPRATRTSRRRTA